MHGGVPFPTNCKQQLCNRFLAAYWDVRVRLVFCNFWNYRIHGRLKGLKCGLILNKLTHNSINYHIFITSNIKAKNGPKIGKFLSAEAGNEALESSQCRRNNGGLRFPKFNFQKKNCTPEKYPNRQPKIRNNCNAGFFLDLKIISPLLFFKQFNADRDNF